MSKVVIDLLQNSFLCPVGVEHEYQEQRDEALPNRGSQHSDMLDDSENGKFKL